MDAETERRFTFIGGFRPREFERPRLPWLLRAKLRPRPLRPLEPPRPRDAVLEVDFALAMFATTPKSLPSGGSREQRQVRSSKHGHAPLR